MTTNRAMLTAAAMLVFAGAAHAQPAFRLATPAASPRLSVQPLLVVAQSGQAQPERRERAVRTQQMRREREASQRGGETREIIRRGPDGETRIVIREGDITRLVIDGEEFNPSHASIIDDKILIRPGEGGEPITIELLTPPAPGAPGTPGTPGTPGAIAGVRGPQGGSGAFTVTTTGGPRRVIGISASSPDAALAAHLGIDPEKVILVTSVNEGLPAEKAGVRRFDIITEVEGAPPATLERLREALSNRENGDPIELTILRGGDTLRLKVGSVTTNEGAAGTFTFEGEAQGAPGAAWRAAPLEQMRRMEELRRERVETQERVRRAVRELVQQQREAATELKQGLVTRLRDTDLRLSDEQARRIEELVARSVSSIDTEQLRASLEEALASLEALSEDLEPGAARGLNAAQDALREAQRMFQGQPVVRFRDGERPGAVVVPPPPPAPAAPPPSAHRGAPEDQRLESLEQRMERIERLLTRLAEREEGRRGGENR